MRFIPFRRSGPCQSLRYDLIRHTDCAAIKSTLPALIRRSTFALGLATPLVAAPLVRAAEGLAL
jgi:hypothetical protein